MKAEAVLSIHQQLWQRDPPAIIFHDGRDYPVEVKDNPSQSFRSVTVDGRLIITQNMRKNSSNTRWVNERSGNKLTWIILNGQYIGKISSTRIGGKDHHEVKQLVEDKVVLSSDAA